ncbi:hypothetical protein H9L39_00314 [Fusarium oxysporum f. sp. albedinis]|nr:hypothetical protein H9L39_00314 [Fusarium oxysporum f. sp. albedinis]
MYTVDIHDPDKRRRALSMFKKSVSQVEKNQAEQLAMIISSTLDESDKAILISAMEGVSDRACERLETQTRLVCSLVVVGIFSNTTSNPKYLGAK